MQAGTGFNRRFDEFLKKQRYYNEMMEILKSISVKQKLAGLTGFIKGNLRMRILVVIIATAVFGYLAVPSGNADSALDNASYMEIQVNGGDTVWNIASRYVSNTEDIRTMIYAIRKANKLNNNADIYPGQVLKIPVETQTKADSAQ